MVLRSAQNADTIVKSADSVIARYRKHPKYKRCFKRSVCDADTLDKFRFCTQMSRHTKLVSASQRREGGPPPIYRWVSANPPEKLSEPIVIRFSVKKSSEVNSACRIFLGGFGTA